MLKSTAVKEQTTQKKIVNNLKQTYQKQKIETYLEKMNLSLNIRSEQMGVIDFINLFKNINQGE